MKKFNYDDFDMFRSIKVEDICSYNSKDVDGNELENGFDILKYSWNYDGKFYERVMNVGYDYGGSIGGSNYMWGDDYLNDENGMMFIRVVELLVESGCMDFNELDGYDVNRKINKKLKKLKGKIGVIESWRIK